MGSLEGIPPRVEEMEKIDEEESFGYAHQIASSPALCATLHAAIQLGVLQIIDKSGPNAKLSPSEIAAQLPTKNPNAAEMLDRMLRLLASHNVLSCSMVYSQRHYGLSPVGRHFVPNEDGVSMAPFITLSQERFFIDSWSELKNAVLEGGLPFNRIHGINAFEYLVKNPTLYQTFNNAMVNHTTTVIKEILECYNGFENLKKLVDVGGGLGINIKLITSKYPSIKGINFDLPEVVQEAPHYPGVEHVGGDMFKSIPNADAVLLKWILHDWSDEHCLRLLKNCYQAIPDNGKVIVVEVVLPIMPKSSPAERNKTQLDMVMLVQFEGGKERTQDEFISLAKRAGFKHVNFVSYVCTLWVMEFCK